MSRHHQTPEWYRFTRRVRPTIQHMLPLPCVDCGRPVLPEQTWHVGHITPAALGGENTLENVGPSHGRCNVKAGGRIGARMSNTRHRIEGDMREW